MTQYTVKDTIRENRDEIELVINNSTMVTTDDMDIRFWTYDPTRKRRIGGYYLEINTYPVPAREYYLRHFRVN